VNSNGISWAICNSAPLPRQITMPAPHHSFFTGQMPFLPCNQHCQSTEGQLKLFSLIDLQKNNRPNIISLLFLEENLFYSSTELCRQCCDMLASRYVSWLPSFSVEVTHMLGYATRQQQAPTSQFDNMVSGYPILLLISITVSIFCNQTSRYLNCCICFSNCLSM